MRLGFECCGVILQSFQVGGSNDGKNIDHKSKGALAKFQHRQLEERIELLSLRALGPQKMLNTKEKQDFVKYNFFSCCVDLSHILDRSNRTLPGCSFPGTLGY